MPLRIANAAGFLGDNLDAPRLTVEAAQVDYLTLEYLAELTMSILARQREKNPRLGYAEDFITVLVSLVPALTHQRQLRIVTNAGGVNPLACARAAGAVLVGSGLSARRIGVVTGDDLLPRLLELQEQGCRFENLDTGESLANLARPIVCANAYLGAGRSPMRLPATPILSSPAASPTPRLPSAPPHTRLAGSGMIGIRLPAPPSPATSSSAAHK